MLKCLIFDTSKADRMKKVVAKNEPVYKIKYLLKQLLCMI